MKCYHSTASSRGFVAGIAIVAMSLGLVTAATAAIGEPAYAGRRVDHVAPVNQITPPERAEFAAMESGHSASVNEPAYSGRRADHLPEILGYRKGEHAEFAALEGAADAQVANPRTEVAYGGRRADHLELYR